MSTINGNATIYGGAPVDYISIFDWVTGYAISIKKPNIEGDWEYTFTETAEYGITYIATNYAPVTHGPYSVFIEKPEYTGFLFVSQTVHPDRAQPKNDILAIEEPTWDEYFGTIREYGLYDYKKGLNISTPYREKVIELFDINWQLLIEGRSWTNSSTFEWFIEFMDADNNVLGAIKAAKLNEYQNILYYGKNMTSLTRAPFSGWAVYVHGSLTFTPTSVTYTHTHPGTTNDIPTFTLDMATTLVTKVKVGGSSSMETVLATTGGYIRILSPVSQ